MSAGLVGQLETQIGSVLRGKADVVRLAVVCLLARGHMLIEDVPGVGKTTLAQALARSLGVDFQRIQFTSDLLPSDIVGVSIYREASGHFEFVRGPLFASVVLADEINRASPKTQSALLEAMSERQVSVDGALHRLPEPFLVVATQNPMEYVGTFPLPESQLDRFSMSLRVGYPELDDEKGLLLSGGVEDTLDELRPVLSRAEILQLQSLASEVHVEEKIVDYLLALAHASREASSEFMLGVSTRGVQGLYRAAQAMALTEGRSYVVPDDVQALAVAVLAHRVVLKTGDGTATAARQAVERLVSGTPVPV